jgi:hypothetical protein
LWCDSSVGSRAARTTSARLKPHEAIRLSAQPPFPDAGADGVEVAQVDDPADRVMFLLKGCVMSQAAVNLEGDMLGTDAIYNPRATTSRGYVAVICSAL